MQTDSILFYKKSIYAAHLTMLMLLADMITNAIETST